MHKLYSARNLSVWWLRKSRNSNRRKILSPLKIFSLILFLMYSIICKEIKCGGSQRARERERERSKLIYQTPKAPMEKRVVQVPHWSCGEMRGALNCDVIVKPRTTEIELLFFCVAILEQGKLGRERKNRLPLLKEGTLELRGTVTMESRREEREWEQWRGRNFDAIRETGSKLHRLHCWLRLRFLLVCACDWEKRVLARVSISFGINY